MNIFHLSNVRSQKVLEPIRHAWHIGLGSDGWFLEEALHSRDI